MRLIRLLMIPVAALALVLGVPVAHAEEPMATSYQFEGKLEADGTLQVTETLTFDALPARVTQRFATRAPIDRHSYHQYEFSEFSIEGGEDVERSRDGDYEVVSFTPSQEVRISYGVKGTTRVDEAAGDGGTVFSWRVLQGLSVPVAKAEGVLKVAALPQFVDCTAGPPGALDKCVMAAAGTHDAPMPVFESDARGAGEQVTFTVGLQGGSVAASAVVKEEWNLDRAFTADLTTVGAALATLALGSLLLWWLFRRTGRDTGFDGDAAVVGAFRPVGDGESVFETADGVRPGLVGTVADERVDPVDITATLLDLAVRGHLRITEQQHPQHGMLDWELTRLENPADRVAAFEERLLDAIVPNGRSSLVSELPTALAPALPGIQDALYDEVVTRGWFDSRPDATRSSWKLRGWVALGTSVVALVLLAAFTRFGLLGLVLVALAAGLLFIGNQMPRRTAEGARVLGGLGALSSLLATHSTTQMPKGRELVEISRLLPYAVVLGGRQRWLEAMAAADDDDLPDPTDLDWYHAPETWHLRDLPASLNQFVNTVQGELFSR
ncbi:DUF2207 domain-containing protein [Arachnia propionica]|uniref:DUF2207 domain-containing protein n=1 Tax=Arachnia propionica TaxID=1750 RepID=A0A3P1TA52_9ACTN|nr:DUF2207 domain-containing protein [Arachnia propionica]RRD06322.1 DUF2207 domain-containing protein [Arachnia propionica]